MIGRLVAHDLRWLTAAGPVLATALLTGFVVALVGLVALHDTSERALAAAAIVWTVAALAGLLAAARLLAAEAAGGGLRALLLAPIDRRDLFLARAVTTSLIVMVLALLAWAAVAVLFPDVPGLAGASLLPVLVVGSVGLGVLGALTGWAALTARGGELLGPVVGVPLAAPLLVSCLHATEGALATGSPWSASLTFAAGYTLAVGALSYLVSAFVVEGT